MMKHTDMIQLIGDLCIEEFVAGGKTDVDSVKSARAMRARLFDAVRELYQELEFESCEREQYQVDLKKANDKINDQEDKIRELTEQLNTMNEIYEPRVPDHHDWSDDLPFPEVERKHVDAVEDIAEGRRGGR